MRFNEQALWLELRRAQAKPVNTKFQARNNFNPDTLKNNEMVAKSKYTGINLRVSVLPQLRLIRLFKMYFKFNY